MIGRYGAMAQVERLRGTDFFAALNPQGVEELVIALAGAADPATAVLVVDEWLRNNRQRPTPFDIYQGVERWNQLRQSAELAELRQREKWISFDDWKRMGYPPDFDAFLDWACSQAPGLPRPKVA